MHISEYLSGTLKHEKSFFLLATNVANFDSNVKGVCKHARGDKEYDTSVR